MSGHVLRLYGEIGSNPFTGQGTSAAQFAEDLPKEGGDLEVRINSEGGSVVEGFAIANALLSYPGPVTAIVEGQASSIASVIVAAAGKIKMYEASLMILHAPWSDRGGDAGEHRRTAETLEALEGLMRKLYHRRGISDEMIDSWFSGGDTLLTPQEAKAVGLCDEIIHEPARLTAQARARLLAHNKRVKMNYEEMDRAQLRAAYKSESDEEEKAKIAKALAEKEDTTTGDRKARVKSGADQDPDVQAAVSALLAPRMAELDQMRLGIERERAETKREREEMLFVKEASLLPEVESRGLFAKLGNDLGKARAAYAAVAAVAKSKNEQSIFAGGMPRGSSGRTSPHAVTEDENGISRHGGVLFKNLNVSHRVRALVEEAKAKGDKRIPSEIYSYFLKQVLSERSV